MRGSSYGARLLGLGLGLGFRFSSTLFQIDMEGHVGLFQNDSSLYRGPFGFTCWIFTILNPEP